MSHATVMVIQDSKHKKTIRDLMAPYDENLEVEPRIAQTFSELVEEAKSAVAHYREDAGIKAAIAGMSPKAWIKKYGSDLASEEGNMNSYEWHKKIGESLVEELSGKWTDKDYHDFIIDGSDIIDEDGNRLTTYNPESKWDWYVVGGRWSGLLIKKDGSRVDSAAAKDIDWDAMYKLDPETEEMQRAFWKIYVLGEPKPEHMSKQLEEKLRWTMYKPEYYIDRYKDEENYIRQLGMFETYAVLTGDGVWHEPGTMGWFACSTASAEDESRWTEEFKSKFIDTLDPDSIVTIVDYHI